MRACWIGLLWSASAVFLRNTTDGRTELERIGTPAEQNEVLNLKDLVAHQGELIRSLASAAANWTTAADLPKREPLKPLACSALKSCTECADESACGWCAVERACHDGNSKGPNGFTCMWEFDQCSLPASCEERQGCAECSGDGHCGFCETTQTCSSGSAAGPGTGTCSLLKTASGPIPGWVHGNGLRPACPQVAPVGRVDVNYRDQLNPVINSAEARAQAAVTAVANAAPTTPPAPCRTMFPPSTVAPTTVAPTVLPTTTPPVIKQVIYLPPGAGEATDLGAVDNVDPLELLNGTNGTNGTNASVMMPASDMPFETTMAPMDTDTELPPPADLNSTVGLFDNSTNLTNTSEPASYVALFMSKFRRH